MRVRVVTRVRPTDKTALKLYPDGKSLRIHLPNAAGGGASGKQPACNLQADWHFQLAAVHHNTSQDALYGSEPARLVNQCLRSNISGSIIAYGSRSAGKTFTMVGRSDSFEERGIIPRALTDIMLYRAEHDDLELMVRVSCLEIFNEQLVDLLCAGRDAPLSVAHDGSVKGLTMRPVVSEQDALTALFQGQSARRPAGAHFVFTVHFECRSLVESDARLSRFKLQFVDMAGTDRSTARQGKDKGTVAETMTFLEQVVIALNNNREHVPYRQCRLTHVLRDALGGNSNTLLIANIRGESEHLEESVGTLRFAQRVSSVNNTVIHSESDELADQLQRKDMEIAQLREELAMRDTLAAREAQAYTPFTTAQRNRLRALIRRYVDGEVGDIPIESVRQIQQTFREFRMMLREAEMAAEQYRQAPPTPRSAFEEEDCSMSSSIASELTMPVKTKTPLRTRTGNAGAPPAATPSSSTTTAGAGGGGPPSGVGSLARNSGVAMGHAASGVPISPAMASGSRQRRTLVTRAAPSTPNGSRKVEASASDQALAQAISNDLAIGLPLEDLADMSREEAFETYKESQSASETMRDLSEAKTMLAAKRSNIKELGLALNALKKRIDEKEAVMQANHAYFGGGGGGDLSKPDAQVVDEDVFELLNEVRALKKEYRQAFRELQTEKRRAAEREAEVVAVRERLLEQFDKWHTEVQRLVQETSNRPSLAHTYGLLHTRGSLASVAEEGLGLEEAWRTARFRAPTPERSPSRRLLRASSGFRKLSRPTVSAR